MSYRTCAEIVEQITEYLENALSDEEFSAFLEHLQGCSGCEAYLGEMRSTVRLLSSTPECPLTPQAELAVIGAFRRWSEERVDR